MSSDDLYLLHLVNARSANVGNGALTLGAEAVLSEDLRPPIRWSREAWDDYSFGTKSFDRAFVDLINASDGMIVGGAVALNGRIHSRNAGMRFDLPLELWREVKKPLIFYGLSHRHWPGQVYHHADKLKRALDVILGRSDTLLALRNDGTRTWLAKTLGFTSDRLHVVPDSTVFMPAQTDGSYPEIEKGRLNVILSFNDEDRENRYGVPERRMAVIKGLAKAMERLLETTDANLILAAHYFDDNRMMADFIDICRPQLAHQRMISVGSARIPGSPHFYGRYLQADLVISMRVHSMAPCIGLGVPMVPLVTQDRMTDFLREVALDDLAVDAFSDDMAENLSGAIDRTLSNRQTVRDRFLQARARMRTEAKAFNLKVQALLDA